MLPSTIPDRLGRSTEDFSPRRIGFIGFDGITALSLTGPMEAFAAARVATTSGESRPGYELVVLGLTPRPFVAESGAMFQPNLTLALAPELDTLVIPGGPGISDPATNAALVSWLGDNAARFRRVVSVCTGIYGLAPTGLLDGRRVATHWRFAADVSERFPALRVEPDALVVHDGPFHTSGGITAGIDLALSLIEEDYGSSVALAVARQLVIYLKRPGGQQQFSESLPVPERTDDRLAELHGWIAGNLHEDLSVESLARRLDLSTRHFTRVFARAFGRSPAVLIEDMRLNEARRLLVLPGASVASVSRAVGFRNPDTFRRTFLRRMGVSPSYYRHRFEPRRVAHSHHHDARRSRPAPQFS